MTLVGKELAVLVLCRFYALIIISIQVQFMCTNEAINIFLNINSILQ